MPMPAPRRLALLGLVLAAGVVFVVVGRFGTSSPAAGGAGAPTSGAQSANADGGVPDVRLEQLQHDEGPFQTPVRNPFRFERRTVPGDPRGPLRPRRVVQAAPPEPVGPPPDPPPPPIPLRFIGFLEPKDGQGRIAVLSDGRGTVIDGKEGDVIEGRYRLLRVGNDSADLAYLDGRGRQTIRLSGQ
jgi:hypothetical protein